MATKKYDEDFKQMIVELYENKKPVCEIKREYGIPDATLYRWIKEYGKIRTETGETTNNHEMKKLKKEIYQNKVDKGFNITDVNKEFCLTYGEVTEAYEAWRKKKDDLGEELADVAIYLLGLSEILGINLEDEIQKKIYKNSKREYKVIDGVNTRVKEFEEDTER